MLQQANLGMIDHSKFVKLEEIGSGQFGTVYRVWAASRMPCTYVFLIQIDIPLRLVFEVTGKSSHFSYPIVAGGRFSPGCRDNMRD